MFYRISLYDHLKLTVMKLTLLLKCDFINFAVTTACMARKTILIGSLVLFNIFG